MVCFYTATTMKSRTRRRESAKNGCTSEMAYSKYSMCNLSEEKLHFLSNISSEKNDEKTGEEAMIPDQIDSFWPKPRS